jgi:hypothetical protein
MLWTAGHVRTSSETMKRSLLAFLLMLLPVQALAQEWQRFGIERYGFIFDLPPDFALTKRSENGDGATFQGMDGAFLAIWGADLEKQNFRAEIENRMRLDEAEGWNLTYKRVTPNWASYSGIKDGQIRYVRAITVCDDRAAVFLIDYSREDKIPYDPIVTRMVRSLKAEGC